MAIRKMDLCDGHAAQPLLVRVPDDIAQMVEQLSEASGCAPEVLVLSALRSHFAPIPRALIGQFSRWEQASEHDAARCGPFRGDL